MGSQVVIATSENFEKLIAESAKQPLIIDFWAEWCGPCRMMEQPYENLAEAHPEVTFAKLDIDANPGAGEVLGVMGIPTFILFQDGQEIHRIVGAKPESDFWAVVAEKFGL